MDLIFNNNKILIVNKNILIKMIINKIIYYVVYVNQDLLNQMII